MVMACGFGVVGYMLGLRRREGSADAPPDAVTEALGACPAALHYTERISIRAMPKAPFTPPR